jgi:hypothetical protein
VPALSVAIGQAGRLLYEAAFGWADREQREAASQQHLFRIASVAKPITSVAIFSLIEAGRIRLNDRVFGPGAITGIDYGRPPYHPNIEEITLEHLLTHTGGGWSNERTDPMFMNGGTNHAELIEWTLHNRPLDHPPRRTQEVKYYGQGDNPYGMNIARMDSHGGWIARPADLVQLFMHVSGFSPPANILKPQTIQTMTTGSSANAGYAKGWAVNKAPNWWHNGSLPGTSSIAVRTHSGFCWAAFTNTRRNNSALDGDLDGLIWAMAKQVKVWRV